ncbi:STAS domain-containing protein, partial [Candidatus Gracilibacteria bacterium]|nr:STAS domain-containing protein [Candidatus Gracilibacteria bacterium]
MLARVKHRLSPLAQPVRLLQNYPRRTLRADVMAGATVGIVLLPQALAFSLLAGLPPEMGLYSAIMAAIVGALWGSSSHLHSGPTNTAAILTLSVLLPIAAPGSPEFVAAAGLVAVMAGVMRLLMGLAGLGMLVNFVSDSVAVGFTAGAGLLIISNQIEPILRLDLPGDGGLLSTLLGTATLASNAHLPSLILGLATMALLLVLPRLTPKLPAVLLAVVAVSIVAWGLSLERSGVAVLGPLPQTLPPLAQLPLLDLDLIGQLANGALALALIGLVEAMAIARAVASHSRQRLDSNQEFVGQGLANIAAGLFSGYPCSGSFNRSALSYQSGAQSALGNVFSGLFVAAAIFLLGPLIAHLPRAVLAGALVITAYSMVDIKSMRRIWRGSRNDAAIMAVTLLATLLLPLQFAVLIGVLMSLGAYLLRTSAPRVQLVLPDDEFRHWVARPEKPACPELAVVEVMGDLYFGAVNYVEERIYDILNAQPQQRFLLLRMHSVNQIDYTGIRALENIMRFCRERGGDLYFIRMREPVWERMRATGFADALGQDHFLDEDTAISFLFHRKIDPAVCIYECEVRAWHECQNLPKRSAPINGLIPLSSVRQPPSTPVISAAALWQELRGQAPPLVIDVREPREFRQGHIPNALLMPLPELLTGDATAPIDRPLVLVCRSGRRSSRAAAHLAQHGYTDLRILNGGMLAWEAAHLLEAVETGVGEHRTESAELRTKEPRNQGTKEPRNQGTKNGEPRAQS